MAASLVYGGTHFYHRVRITATFGILTCGRLFLSRNNDSKQLRLEVESFLRIGVVMIVKGVTHVVLIGPHDGCHYTCQTIHNAWKPYVNMGGHMP